MPGGPALCIYVYKYIYIYIAFVFTFSFFFFSPRLDFFFLAFLFPVYHIQSGLLGSLAAAAVQGTPLAGTAMKSLCIYTSEAPSEIIRADMTSWTKAWAREQNNLVMDRKERGD